LREEGRGRGSTHFIHIHLLAITVVNKPLKVSHDQRPGFVGYNGEKVMMINILHNKDASATHR
jgi:hypothetical protein